MPSKSYTSQKSAVISIKLPQIEIRLMNEYIKHEKLSTAEFFIALVNEFVQLGNVFEFGNHRLVEEILKVPDFANIYEYFFNSPSSPPQKYGVKPPSLEKVTFRVQKINLHVWDIFCEKHFLTRTGLIRSALFEFFHARDRHISPTKAELHRIRRLLEALFSGIGAIEENRIMSLFNHYDPGTIYDVLTQLESQGKIGRKVSENNRVIFVPTGMIQDTGEEPLLAHFLRRLI